MVTLFNLRNLRQEGDALILQQSRYGASSARALTEPPLGIVTKNPSPELNRGSAPISVDAETGEILTPSHHTARANRWGLKSAVNRILPGSRTSKCMVLRAPIPGHGLAPIEVQKGQACKRAFYHGLMACGSVWSCPICAAKIAERRRLELSDALESARAKGWRVHLVTLTIPHGVGDDLRAMLAGLRGALKRLSHGKYAISAQLGGALKGYIRALEVTHGRNGWHPHYHLLVMTEPHIKPGMLQDVYRPAWKRACRLAGLPEPSDTHGCTVQDGEYAAKYASKWGLEDEMTKGHTKQTRRKGCSPWGLLRCVLDGDDPDYTPERATALFRLYADAFKGSRQLHWSAGLRAELELGKEVSDEILAERPDDERAIWVGELTVEDWRAVRRGRAEAAVLDAAEGGPESLAAILQQLRRKAGKSVDELQVFHDGKRIDSGVFQNLDALYPAVIEVGKHIIGQGFNQPLQGRKGLSLEPDGIPFMLARWRLYPHQGVD